MADVIAIVSLMADVNAIGGWWNTTEFYVVSHTLEKAMLD